jgi:hypothetical protein
VVSQRGDRHAYDFRVVVEIGILLAKNPQFGRIGLIKGQFKHFVILGGVAAGEIGKALLDYFQIQKP